MHYSAPANNFLPDDIVFNWVWIHGYYRLCITVVIYFHNNAVVYAAVFSACIRLVAAFIVSDVL